MSTDIYGVRVLDVDPMSREVRFRVFLVYYEVASRTHPPLPELDAGFFFGLLWERSTVDEVVSLDQFLDRAWVVPNARWFVEDVQLLEERNHPPTDWEDLHDFYYERNGGWQDEDLLAQGDYLVRVTDPYWLKGLSPGTSWGTTWMPPFADSPAPADLPFTPDVHEPHAVLRPPRGRIERLAFSPDSRSLIITGAGRTVAFDRADWTQLDGPPPPEAEPTTRNGAYRLTAGEAYRNATQDEIRLVRGRDGAVILRHRPGGRVPALTWSPDGELVAFTVRHEVRVLRVGLPAEPPPALRPPN